MKLSKSNFRRRVGGRFFTVTFVKANNEVRRMTARLGVRKYLRGTGANKQTRGLVTAWDCGKQAYRSFHLSAVRSLRANGKVYGGAR